VERDLTPLFFPKSVAVVGASPRPDSLAGAVLRNLTDGGFKGRLAAVHPKATWGGAIVTAPSTSDLPFVPDLVIWGVTANVIEQDLPQLLQKGSKAHIVLTAGFSESGPDGSAKERAIVTRIREHGGVMVGPNCMGLHVAEPNHRLDASFCRVRPQPGPAAIFVQSGSVGEWLLVGMDTRRLGATIKVSLGNMGDLDAVDFIDAVPTYFPEVQQIFLYLETMPEATRLRKAMAALPTNVNVLALHGGQSEVGARAVAGHTGALAEEPALVDALLRNVGIRPVASLMEALDTLELLERLAPCHGRRACVVTNAGGPGILVADALVTSRFSLPEPSDALKESLRGIVSPAASLGNPIDLIASATPSIFEASLRLIAHAPDFDVIVPVFMHPITVDAHEIATAMENGVGSRVTDTVVCWMPGAQSFAARDQLRHKGFAVIEEPLRVGRALGHWASLMTREPQPPLPAHASTIEDRRLFDSEWGNPEVLEEALSTYRLPIPSRIRTLNTPSSEQGLPPFPLYVKIETPSSPHKVNSGLLARVENKDQFESVVASMRCPSDGRWLIQEAVRPGPEIYVGFLRHPRLGAFVGFGPGGATAESSAITWLALPAHPKDLDAAVHESPAATWLGKDAAGALASLVEAMASLESRGPMIAMAEVNPAIWDAEAKRLWLVDIRWQARARSLAGEGAINAGPAVGGPVKEGRNRPAALDRPRETP
jgi:acyl-CoA synthetase (NDP forming)